LTFGSGLLFSGHPLFSGFLFVGWKGWRICACWHCDKRCSGSRHFASLSGFWW